MKTRTREHCITAIAVMHEQRLLKIEEKFMEVVMENKKEKEVKMDSNV